MKKYTYLVNFDSQALERVGESFAVKGDGGIAELEFIIPSDFGIPPTQAVWRAYYKLPGERESLFETLPTVEQTESGDYVTGWVVTKALTQTSGRLGFSLAAISGNNIQWNSRTVIMQVPESQYQPESEEAEEPYTGRLAILEGDMAAIRGEFGDVVDEFEELKATATLGTPIPESLVANMQEGHVYIYTGTEPGYTAGHVYYYVGGALTDGGVYGGTAVDATLTQSGQAADAKVVGDEITEIKEDLSALSGLSEDVKQALLACFAKVAWVDANGQTYYDALDDALYPPADLVSISAVYTQSGTVYTTDSLGILKPDLVVTAHYSDSTSRVVTEYVLSGTLTEGMSTVMVSYGGKTATFDVTVTQSSLRLPAEYQEVEWISSDSSDPYFNTGFIPTPQSSMYASMACVGAQSSQNYIGCRDGATGANKAFAIASFNSANKIGFMRWGSSVQCINYDTDWHDYELTPSTSKIDETPYSMNSPAEQTMSIPVRVGAMVNGTNWTFNMGMFKLAYLRLEENGVPMRELVPCYRKADGEIGMYDIVNDVFYTNERDRGTFTKGGDVR